jgi:quercetin dioxygenase-like cupin family protein
MISSPITPRFTVTQDGVTLNIYHANKGEGLPRHDHTYSHLTMCFAGSVQVTKENVKVVITKDDQPVNLVANEWHELEAAEDGTVFVNVFAEGKY